MKAVRDFTIQATGIVTALLVGFSASTASADEHHRLHGYKSWAVDFVDNSRGSNYCMMASHKKGGTAISIMSRGNGVDIAIHVNGADWRYHVDELSFEVDNRGGWTYNDAVYEGNRIYMQDIKLDVVWELAKGNTLYLHNSRGEFVESWSLAGSMASVNALADCAGKVGNTTAARY